MKEVPKQPSSSEQSKKGDSAIGAGRGGLALAGGKIYFLVTGLFQQIALKQILGLAGYGAYSTASSIGSIWYNPLIQAGIQGVSRQTASADQLEQRYRKLLRFHTGASLGVALLFLLCAESLASLLGAPHVTAAVRVLSCVLFLYGVYAATVGYLNGRRRFVAQAGLDVFSATLRTVGLLAGAMFAVRMGPLSSGILGQPVAMAMVGFCVAALSVLVLALRLTGWGARSTGDFSVRGYATVIVPIWAGQLLLNVLFQADGLLLRKFAADAAFRASLPFSEADPYVGAYRASQLFCFLPFQLLTSITFVLFPLLAKARAETDEEQVSQLVSRGLRIAVLIATAIVTVVVAVPEGLLTLVFQEQAAALAGTSMRILAVGMGFFALLGVTTSALNSLGAERRSLGLIALAVVLVAALGFWLAGSEALEARLLTSMATATSLALTATSLAALWALHSVSGATVPPATAVRTVLAGAVSATLVGRFVPEGHLFTLLGSVAAAALFLALLAISGELKASDWQQLRQLFIRNKA